MYQTRVLMTKPGLAVAVKPNKNKPRKIYLPYQDLGQVFNQ